MDDYGKYLNYLPYFLISLLVSFLLTPVVGYLARKYGVMDLPSSMRKKGDRGAASRMKSVPIPRMGGLAVMITFISMSLIFLPISKELIGLIIAVLILGVMGIIDDKNDLSGKTQLFIQIIAALIIVLTGTGVDYLRNPFGGEISLILWQVPLTIRDITYNLSLPADIITVLWIVLVINSVNWTAGIDGLVEGLTGISAIIITLLSVRFFTHPTALMGSILAGAVLGFLPFNFNPAKIISGTIGTNLYGFLLAVLSIYSGAKFATAFMILALPIIDALWVLIDRIRHMEKGTPLISILQISDRTHLHHRLLDFGLSVRQVDFVEYSIVAILGLIGFWLTGLMKAMALFTCSIVIIAIIIYTTSKRKSLQKPVRISVEGESPEKKYTY